MSNGNFFIICNSLSFNNLEAAVFTGKRRRGREGGGAKKAPLKEKISTFNRTFYPDLITISFNLFVDLPYH